LSRLALRSTFEHNLAENIHQ